MSDEVQAHPVVSLFADLVTRDDEAISLPAAAVALAGVHYPDIELRVTLDQMEYMREQAREASAGGDEPLVVLNRVMFDELRFTGNRENYYDIRNSLLNDVLERRTGIPITLSLVYLELADAIGRPMEGVSFPGHFLVRDRESGLLLDPFDRGRIVDRDECLAILAGMGLSEEDWSEDFLDAATPREVLHRMINNLRGCYNRAGDHRRLAILDEIFSMLQSGKDEGSVLQ